MNANTISLSQKIFINRQFIRKFSISFNLNAKENYKLVVVGGGCGGLSTAAKFVRKLGAGNVAIIEPSNDHCN